MVRPLIYSSTAPIFNSMNSFRIILKCEKVLSYLHLDFNCSKINR
jgi:hypothetical protein